MRPRYTKAQRPSLARLSSKADPIIAPIGGLNTRDSLSAMDPTDAVELTNILPQQKGVLSRRGSVNVTTGYSQSVETSLPYIQNTTKLLITASADKVFTDNGGGTKTQIGNGFLNARWQGAKSGANMIIVNAQDLPQLFDGATLEPASITGDAATYGLAKLGVIHKHNNRIYLADPKNGDFFYGGVNAIAGDFTKFQLSLVSRTGGNITEIKTMSQATSNGIQSYLVFILNTGEVIIYQGSDPGDATDFGIQGSYNMPPIIGQRCAVEFGGDVFILTNQDIIKLSDVLKYTGEEGGFDLNPSKLSGGIQSDYQTYGGNWGFSVTSYPKGGWLIINIPEVTNQIAHQYVINLVTGAACKFTNWNANVFSILNNNLYFGGSTALLIADSGYDDNGVAIPIVGFQAYNNMGMANKKTVSGVRLYIGSDGDLSIDLAIAYDFSSPSPQGTQVSTSGGVQWGSGVWNVSMWSGPLARFISFVVGGLGVYIAPRISMQIKGQQINWYATLYNFKAAKAY